MPTPDVTAGEVMELAAALLNDTARQLYTDTNMLPYLKIALKDLRLKYENAGFSVTNDLSTVITLDAGTTELGFATNPALPENLISIIELWESPEGQDKFTPVIQKNYIPNNIVTPVSAFGIYAWRENTIFVPEATADIDLKIDYVGQIFRSISDANSVLGAINGDAYLHYRTAALCAFYIGENKTRADELNGEATIAFNEAFGIETKSKQDIATRRKPFRSNRKLSGRFR